MRRPRDVEKGGKKEHEEMKPILNRSIMENFVGSKITL